MKNLFEKLNFKVLTFLRLFKKLTKFCFVSVIIFLFFIPALNLKSAVIYITNKNGAQDGYVYDSSGGAGPGTGFDSTGTRLYAGEGTTAQNRVYRGLIRDKCWRNRKCYCHICYTLYILCLI